jgi:hypothetical protein
VGPTLTKEEERARSVNTERLGKCIFKMGSIYRVFIEVAVVGHDFKWVLGVFMHIRKGKRKSTTTFGQKPPSNLGLSASNLDGTSSWKLSLNGKAYLIHQHGQLMVSRLIGTGNWSWTPHSAQISLVPRFSR